MNKKILTLGTIATLITPVATMLSCGSKTPKNKSGPTEITNIKNAVGCDQSLLDQLNADVSLGVNQAIYEDDLKISGNNITGSVILKFTTTKGNTLDVVGLSPHEDVNIVFISILAKDNSTNLKVTVNEVPVSNKNPEISKLIKDIFKTIENKHKSK